MVKDLNRETLLSTRSYAKVNHIAGVTVAGLKPGEISPDHLQALDMRHTKQLLGFHHLQASQEESF